MKRTKSKLPLWWLAAALTAVLALAYWMVMLKEALLPYKSFNDVKRVGGRAQVYGQVISNYRSDDAGCIEFTMEDATGQRERVRYCGVPPIGLEKGRHVVAIVEFDKGLFVAHQLLTKCPSKYGVKNHSAR
ncbi:MAG: cytochrome c maturation protein CcmE [Armatimonadota bacterium]|nr:cytochrome c maturation protein CcmE [Armatimonadota bacterium]MCX7777010.1 cytochrome c maturation protein CcmE [Armatimonadota bacterium]MDW8024922.1 cytochrome c maturation protein CcmE [Armatimonadota bacterium]